MRGLVALIWQGLNCCGRCRELRLREQHLSTSAARPSAEFGRSSISSQSHSFSNERDAHALLARAKALGGSELGELLQLYRNYLSILATAQLDARLRRRISPSDLVQEALLGAYRDFGQFRGGSERELLAWLRQILINCLHHAYETHIKAGRRDLRREVSLDDVGQALDRSAMRLGQCLADRVHSPSAPAHASERAVEIADQLAKLRPDYREVIVLRNLQGMSFEEVAVRMERKPGAVRMLWLRAIEQFRNRYEATE
jgi:RNA polymerase sigma-70 factor (ECF subfamily)